MEYIWDTGRLRKGRNRNNPGLKGTASSPEGREWITCRESSRRRDHRIEKVVFEKQGCDEHLLVSFKEE
jgi:hypothetical protein